MITENYLLNNENYFADYLAMSKIICIFSCACTAQHSTALHSTAQHST